MICLSDIDNIKTFKEWINQFIEKEIPFGDLSRDMDNDSELPDSNDRMILDRYLDLERSACNDALTTFHTAYDEYEQYVDEIVSKNSIEHQKK